MTENKQNDFDYDIVVVGGGPAGSTAATLLAQYGHRVLLLESGKHPRFHIGESMLPFSEPVLQRLGLDWSVGNQFKSGAVFIDEATDQRMYFPLSVYRKTYQLERGPFDQLLFQNAAAQGVDTQEQEKVLDVDCKLEGVDIISDKARYRCRYLIDATGRSALMGKKGRTIERIENLGKFAVYTHYQNIQSGEEADELFRSGSIYVPVVDIGWLWIIPLAGRRLSVGLVVQSNRRRSASKRISAIPTRAAMACVMPVAAMRRVSLIRCFPPAFFSPSPAQPVSPTGSTRACSRGVKLIQIYMSRMMKLIAWDSTPCACSWSGSTNLI